MSPRITILIANYNGEAFLKRALRSALAQTLPRADYEILVADDGSTDGSMKILESHGADLRVLRLDHGGLPATCNAGIRETRTPLLIRLDSDDELEPSALQDLAAEHERRPKAVFVGADRTDVNAETGEAAPVRVDPKNMFDLIAPGVLFRTDTLIEAGMYDTQYWEEYDLFTRLLLKGTSAHVAKPLYRYYRHPASMTADPESRIGGWKSLLEKWDFETLRRFGSCPELDAVHEGRHPTGPGPAIGETFGSAVPPSI